MRRNSRDLFELVTKLSPAEKRAISRTAAASGGDRLSKYGILFDEIAAQSEYDEDALQSCARANNIHDLPGSKRYLYNLILDQMTKKLWSETTTGKLRTMVGHAAALFMRGLFTQARTILGKARDLADRSENLEALIQIEAYELRLRMHTGIPSLTAESVDESYGTLIGVIDRLKEVTELEHLASRMYVLEMTDGRIRDGSVKQKAEKLMQSPIVQRLGDSSSPSVQLEWHDLHLRYYRMHAEGERTYFHSRAKVRVLEENPAFADDNKHLCIFSYGHHLMECVKSGRWAEFEHYRTHLVTLRSRYPGRLSTVNEIASYTEIWGAIHRANPQGLLLAIKSAGQFLLKDNGSLELSSIIGISYGLTYGAIMLEDYRMALDWVNRILNNPQLDQVGDVAVYVRLINLLIHYELGNTEVLEYNLRSTFRFLQRRERMYQVESTLLSFIRQLPRIITSEELRELFIELRSELRVLSSDPLERGAMDYFAFDAWLSSKIEGRKFIDLWREERQEVWQDLRQEELVNE